MVAKAAGLLIHASQAITPQPLMPHSPEHQLGDGENAIAHAFGNWFRKLQRTVRYHVERRAEDYVLGSEALHWCRDQHTADTDEAAIEVLQKLDAIRNTKK